MRLHYTPYQELQLRGKIKHREKWCTQNCVGCERESEFTKLLASVTRQTD
jgi:wyosine [tRNA(Phe)-imidazoG37] synthetase (radical SAM superfamily)